MMATDVREWIKIGFSVTLTAALAAVRPTNVLGDNPMTPPPLAYNTKVQFAKGQVLQFPDFSLEFIGTQPLSLNPPVPMGPLFEFRVSSDGRTQTASWSSGTG